MTASSDTPLPPRTWARFFVDSTKTAAPSVSSAKSDASTPAAAPATRAAPAETRVTRYRVTATRMVLGAPLLGVGPGDGFVRVESTDGLPEGLGDLFGVTQHLAYMRSGERQELASSPELGPLAVLVPISKSAAWWMLAQDERDAIFRGAGKSTGHPALGRPHVTHIFRKLYHGRYLPGAGWDFLAYFEFAKNTKSDFEALVASLRDPDKNPEWPYVEREAEIWLTKLG